MGRSGAVSAAVLVVACASQGTSQHAAKARGRTTPTSTTASLTTSPHLRMGTPTDTSPADDLVLDHGVYVLSYNANRLDPNWVAWGLDAHWLGTADRNDRWHPDDLLPATVYHVVTGDYVRSGFDRGHMCPSADRTDNDADNAITFTMTNTQPQLHELNAGPWEQVETYARGLAQQGLDVYQVAGGVFATTPPTIGHGVAVPMENWKVLVAVAHGAGPEGVSATSIAFGVRMPNTAGVRAHPWRSYIVTIDAIEAATGYNLLMAVPQPRQEQIEARVGTAP